MDSHIATTIMMSVIGLMSAVGAIALVGAFWSMGRAGYRKD